MGVRLLPLKSMSPTYSPRPPTQVQALPRRHRRDLPPTSYPRCNPRACKLSMASSSSSNSTPKAEDEDTVMVECRKPEDEFDESNWSEITILRNFPPLSLATSLIP